ncbi:MAG: adenylate/guanylate cyclase domain-containing protein, partial [Anaerolineae bacterium]|nr:adenylate/guanylate cyclase domain-containing protein [Anaerolineae bacterium]
MVQCTACNFENPPRMTYCGQCGAALHLVCAACGFDNPANFSFCGQCGRPLAGHASSRPPAPAGGEAALKPPEAERRQLTVMFCDLVGSTRLSQRLDPEDLHQVVGAYQAVCVAVINRFEGHVAQYLGDGLLVYFGYPVAHEDEAQRAVRAGLGITEAVERLSARLEQDMDVRLAVRVGIHTGRVVVGQIGSGQ